MPFRGPALVVRASLFPIDSKAKFEAKEEGRVITITADSTRPAGKPVPRGIMQPRDFEIPIRLQQPPGTQYTLRVVDRDGNSLIPATKFVYHLAV
jgi:hypothetical protein